MAEAPRPTAAIISVGDELLYGQTVDTNAAWLGRWLESQGIRVSRGFTVHDSESEIREALRLALGAADLVMISGGLGPTPDDLTKGAVARHFGLDLVSDSGVQERLVRHFRAEGFDAVPPLSRGQAEVPAGAVALENPVGTAPGLLLEVDDRRVILLPGVPGELRAIVEGGVADALAGWLARYPGAQPSHHFVVHTTGIRETRLAEEVERLLSSLEPDVTEGIDLAWLPDARGVDLRFTTTGKDRGEAYGRIAALVGALEPVIHPYRFDAPSGDLAEAVVTELKARKLRLAVAESCTGGLLGARITAVSGASKVFVGGVIAYENAVKSGLLGVPESEIVQYGAVSEEVSIAMASGVAGRMGTSTALSITGVAGPGGGSDEKPVGTVWIGVAVNGRVRATRHLFSGGRDLVRERAAQAALATLYREVVAGPPES